MTGEIGLCRNQSIKVKHRDIVADYESLFGIIPRKKTEMMASFIAEQHIVDD